MSECYMGGTGKISDGEETQIKPAGDLWGWKYGTYRSFYEWVTNNFTSHPTSKVQTAYSWTAYQSVTLNADKTITTNGAVTIDGNNWTSYTNYYWLTDIDGIFGFWYMNGMSYNGQYQVNVSGCYVALGPGWREVEGYIFSRTNTTYPVAGNHTDGKYYKRLTYNLNALA